MIRPHIGWLCLSVLSARVAVSETRISWDMEGGSLGRAEQVSAQYWRAHVAGETDQDGRNRQANWYYFQVSGTNPGQTVTIDLTNLPGEYNYKPNRGAVTGDTPPVLSFDNENWVHATDFEFDPAEPKMRVRVTLPQGKRNFWIAHTPPYTNRHLTVLRKWAGSRVDERVIGKSVEGRDLLLWTIGDGQRVVWLFLRQHSWESGSSWAGEGLVRHLLSAEGSHLRHEITWKIFPLCDPDGVARGGVRFNKFGYDLNRNWDLNGVAKMPEIAAQRNAIASWIQTGRGIDFLLSLHNTETSEYLEGPPEQGGGGRYVPLAERLFDLLNKESSFSPTRPLFYADATTTEGKAGRMNVIQGLYRDYHVPGFIMEQRISAHPKYGKRPLAADRLRFGRELAEVIGKAVVGAIR